MNFICKDCGTGVHDVCVKQMCECQHRTDRKNVQKSTQG